MSDDDIRDDEAELEDLRLRYLYDEYVIRAWTAA